MVVDVPELNAITFAVVDMAQSVAFYEALGFKVGYGGPEAEFTSLPVGDNFINLQRSSEPPGIRWGRIIIHVDSPDEIHARAIDAGYVPETDPADASLGFG